MGKHSNFLLSPQFSRGPNAKNSFAWPEFHSLRTGTLATQANPGFLKFNCVNFIDGVPLTKFSRVEPIEVIEQQV